jgi:hypothetical protein
MVCQAQIIECSMALFLPALLFLALALLSRLAILNSALARLSDLPGGAK